jgi:hypothetical protein
MLTMVIDKQDRERAIWLRLWPWLISHDKNAMPQPVLSASWSVCSV